MKDNTVIIKRLATDHDLGTFTKFVPLNKTMVGEIEKNVKYIFDNLGGASLIKSSGDVYIKPNAIDAKAYVHTRPEVVESVIRYWRGAGAKRVFLIENSTQCNITRLVFELTGYTKICRKTGAVPIYLDEEETVTLKFTGKKSVRDGDPAGYDRVEFETSKTIAGKLIGERDKNLYVNIPKLKTHSMGVVTLGIKNQWAFPRHSHRSADHNFNLHHKLVDVLSLVRPDVTLIEGVEGTIYGHYPASALADECVKPFKVLIGSRNVVAADIVGAAAFGLGIDDVPHIKIAVARGLAGGVAKAEDIDLIGDFTNLKNMDIIGDLAKYNGKYPYSLYPRFPSDVALITGKELACKEGCVCNPLTLLQILACDYNGKGGWTLIMGKGFDPAEIDAVKGRALIAGHCAIEEVSSRLIERLGRKNIYLSGECNDLQATTESMLHLMKVNALKMAPINPLKGIGILIQAYRNHTRAKLVNPLASYMKLR